MPEGSKSPARTLTGWLPWILTTVLGGVLVARTGSPDSATVDSKPRMGGTQDISAEGILTPDRQSRIEEPLYRHFGIEPVPKTVLTGSSSDVKTASNADSPSDSKPTSSSRRQQLKRRLASCHLQFLIVTVADPIESSDNYRFDHQLDALHRALQATAGDEWLYETAYLPWQVYRDRLSPTIAIDRREHWYQDEPGLLIYRRRDGSVHAHGQNQVCQPPCEELLIVMLVGELLTTGIHRTAFQRAVEEIDQLCEEAVNHTITIPVVGPTFTGGAHSLIEAIRAAEAIRTIGTHRESPQFRVISGSASSVNRQAFDRQGIPFATTVAYTPRVERRVQQFLAQQNPSARTIRIAWLVESSSGFGGAVLHTPLEEEKSGEASDLRRVESTYFPFPLQISRVRANFGRQAANPSVEIKGLEPIRMTSRLPFDASESAREVPLAQTPQMTAPTIEVVLGQTISAIHREGFQYVGLIATDIRDAIFLSDMVHLHCPGAQLILLQPDLLHTHPEYHRSLHGALLVSSYPLFPEGLSWTTLRIRGEEVQQIFANPSYYGLYNAVLLHRGMECGLIEELTIDDSLVRPARARANVHVDENAQGDLFRRLIGYGRPNGSRRPESHAPELWFQRIGNSGVYPIGWEPISDQDDYTLRIETNQEPPTVVPQLAATVRFPFHLMIAATVLVGLFVGLLWYPIVLAFAKPASQVTPGEQDVQKGYYDFLADVASNLHLISRHSLQPPTRTQMVYAVLLLLAGLFLGTAVLLTASEGSATDEPLEWLTHQNLFSGLSLLLPAVLCFLAVFSEVFGKWARIDEVHDLFRKGLHWQQELFTQDPLAADDARNFRRRLNWPLMTWLWSKAPSEKEGVSVEARKDQREFAKSATTTLVLFGFIGLVPLCHAWREASNVSGTLGLYRLVWYGIAVASCGWWLSYLYLNLLYRSFRRELRGAEARAVTDKWFTDRRISKLAETIQADFGRGIGALFIQENSTEQDAISRACATTSSSKERDYLGVLRMSHVYLKQLQRHAMHLALASVFLWLAINSFPFTDRLWLRLAAASMLGVLVVRVFFSYISLDRDVFLSRLWGSTPLQVEWDLPTLSKIAALALLAGIALVVQLIPDSGMWFSQILAPLSRFGM